MKKRILHIGLLLALGVFVSGALMAQKLTKEQVLRPTDQSAPKTEALGRAIGDDCNEPFLIEVDAVPFSYSDTQDNGTCGHGNTYDGEEFTGWDNGEDVVYKIQTPQEAQAIITLEGSLSGDSSGYFHMVAIFEGCPDSGTLMASANSQGGVNPVVLNQALAANTEYFILVDYWGISADPCLPSYTIDVELSTDIVYFYDLEIAGEQVSSENSGDLSVIEGVTGSVVYDNDSKTLTLDNANISASEPAVGINNTGVEDLKINLIGSNTIQGGVRNEVSSEIAGMGSVSITSTESGMPGIYMLAPLTIKDCSVEAEGPKWGIAGINGQSGEDLVIDHATVKATGAEVASIVDIPSLTLNGGCVITAPESAAFDEELYGVALNGEIVKEQVVIEPADGIQEENLLGVSIYPNPAKDYVEINIEDVISHDLSLQVYDMLGKLIESQSITEQTTQLNIKNLEKGVYILKIGNSTKRLIKN